MTITRIWQAGLESNGTNSHAGEFSAVTDGIATSSTYAKTGTYSMRINGSDYADVAVPSTSQLRSGLHVRGLTLLNNTSPANILSFRSSTAALVGLRVKNDTTLALMIGAVEQDTVAFASPTTEFSHFGLDAKLDASAGWAVVYINGVEVMRFEGNTGATPVVNVRYGDTTNVLLLTYYDDLFIDDMSGETAAAPVADRRFYAITPTGNGTYSQGVGSDGNSTDNYLLVDDRPHNSDTDYIILDAADEKELYTSTTVTPPAGFIFAALIPFAYAKKTDAEVATKLAPLLRLGSVDLEGTAQNLSTSYAMVWERFTAKPGGGVWIQTDIDAVEVGYQGEGAF